MYNKLRAVEIEINAVTSAVEQLESFKRHDDIFSEGEDERKQGPADIEKDYLGASPNDVTLQHALAADRLRSLIKTKAQLEKEILDSSNDIKDNKLLRDLVKEEPKTTRKLKEIQKTSKKKNKNKRLKTVSFVEDDDFDAVLNVASTGFVETVSDFIVVITTLHKHICVKLLLLLVYR